MVSMKHFYFCSISIFLGSSVKIAGLPLPSAGSGVSTEIGQSSNIFDTRGDDCGSVAVDLTKTTGEIRHEDKREYLFAREWETEFRDHKKRKGNIFDPYHYDERSSDVGSRGLNRLAPLEPRASKVRKLATRVASMRPKAKNPITVSKPGGPKKSATGSPVKKLAAIKKLSPVRKLAVIKKPAAAKKPAATKKPTAIKKPADTKKPAAAKKPVVVKKPVAVKKPAATKKPTAIKKPAATKKPTTAKKPAAAKKPAPIRKPAATKKPVAAKKPAHIRKPSPIRKPAFVKKPATVKKPANTKKTTTLKTPTAAKKPKAVKTVQKKTVTKKPNAAKRLTAKHRSKGPTPPRSAPKSPAKSTPKPPPVEHVSKPSVPKPKIPVSQNQRVNSKTEQVRQGKLNKVGNPCKRSNTGSDAGPSCQLPDPPAPPAQPASVSQTDEIEKARKDALNALTSQANEPKKNPKITDVANLFVGSSDDQASIMQTLGHSAQRERKHIVEEKQKIETNLKENEGYIAQNTALMNQQKADLDAKAAAEKAADKERKDQQIAAENRLKGWGTRKEKEAEAVAANKAIGEDSTPLDQLTDDSSSS